MRCQLFRYTAVAAALFAVITSIAFAPIATAAGMVASIKKAPVTADGNVAGRPADFVITLDGSLDHWVAGRSLAVGDVIKVIFPSEFDLNSVNPAYPLNDVPTLEPPCLPGNLQCTTAVLLVGWPQQPLFLPAAFATLSIDTVENALIFTAVQNIEPSLPTSPGIKQLFLMLHGVINPEPGDYLIRVEAQTGAGGAWETGSGIFHVLPHARPSVNPTSVLVKATSGLMGDPACGPGTLPPNPDNPMFQTTNILSPAPFMWTMLMWGERKSVMEGLSLVWVNANHARLVQGKKTVGQVFIDAPLGAYGHNIVVNPLGCPTSMGGAPVIAGTPGIGPQPVGRLDLQFHTGSEVGDYTTTISLNNGNSINMVVTAE